MAGLSQKYIDLLNGMCPSANSVGLGTSVSNILDQMGLGVGTVDTDVELGTGAAVTAITIGKAGLATLNAGSLTVAQTLLSQGVITGGVAGTAAGEVDLVAPTVANGALVLKAVNAGGAFTTTLSNGAMGQSTVMTLRNPVAATSVIPNGTVGAAYTQTYATADRTIVALTAAAITDSTGGAAATTFAAIAAGAVYAQADLVAIKNALAQVALNLNALNADMLDTKQGLNAVIDDHQAFGIAS